jgi:pimeloyl-ACP methyl ester carboxylesterase
MISESHFIPVGKETLHYRKWGHGKRLLLAFHGYGDDADIFYPLQEYLADDYTILSIDLPHHGNSNWTDNLLRKNDIIALVETLKKEYSVEKISLIGYSMGGRVCLSIIEQVPASINKVVLMASDGLTINLYYYFFTRTAIGKMVFRNMLEKPGPYLGVIRWLKKMNMVDASRYKFVMHFLEEKDGRDLLLKVWPGMREFVPSPPKIKAMIRKHHIHVSIFMGEYDKVIPATQAKKFSAGLSSVKVYILKKGHRVFDHENVRLIAGQLL